MKNLFFTGTFTGKPYLEGIRGFLKADYILIGKCVGNVKNTFNKCDVRDKEGGRPGHLC